MAELGQDRLVGRVLGGEGRHYRVVRPIGRGGMGSVYEGVHEELRRRVALKVLLPELVDDPLLLQRFRREAQAAAALGHPNIVQVTDFQMNEGEPPFLVMELVDGVALRDVIKREGHLEQRRTAFIFMQVLSAIGAAHAAGIVHRDIKPANIMLTSTSAMSDIVKICDFGIAKLLDDGGDGPRTSAGIVVGTLAYMAPEQALGQAVDGRTDLYSIAACMFQALAGRRPIDAENTAAMLVAICDREPLPLAAMRADVHPAFTAIVSRALKKAPVERFATAEEMAAALAPLANAPVASSLPSPVSAYAATVVHSVGAPPAAPPLRVDPSTRLSPQGAVGAGASMPTRVDAIGPASRAPRTETSTFGTSTHPIPPPLSTRGSLPIPAPPLFAPVPTGPASGGSDGSITAGAFATTAPHAHAPHAPRGFPGDPAPLPVAPAKRSGPLASIVFGLGAIGVLIGIGALTLKLGPILIPDPQEKAAASGGAPVGVPGAGVAASASAVGGVVPGTLGCAEGHVCLGQATKFDHPFFYCLPVPGAQPPPEAFAAGDHVVVDDGPALIVATSGKDKFKVHYDGYAGSSFDEVVPAKRVRARVCTR